MNQYVNHIARCRPFLAQIVNQIKGKLVRNEEASEENDENLDKIQRILRHSELSITNDVDAVLKKVGIGAYRRIQECIPLPLNSYAFIHFAPHLVPVLGASTISVRMTFGNRMS